MNSMRELGERALKRGVAAQQKVYDARGFFQKKADNEKVRMFADEQAKGFKDFVDLFDTAFRPSTKKGQFEAFKKLLLENGAPSFMLKHEAFMFSAFQMLGGVSPSVSVPILVRSLVAKTSDFMHLGSDPTERFKNSENVEHNINKLGEMILGDIEWKRKQITDWLELYKIPYDDLTNQKPPAIAYIDDRAVRFTNWNDIGNYYLD